MRELSRYNPPTQSRAVYFSCGMISDSKDEKITTCMPSVIQDYLHENREYKRA